MMALATLGKWYLSKKGPLPLAGWLAGRPAGRPAGRAGDPAGWLAGSLARSAPGCCCVALELVCTLWVQAHPRNAISGSR